MHTHTELIAEASKHTDWSLCSWGWNDSQWLFKNVGLCVCSSGYINAFEYILWEKKVIFQSLFHCFQRNPAISACWNIIALDVEIIVNLLSIFLLFVPFPYFHNSHVLLIYWSNTPTTSSPSHTVFIHLTVVYVVWCRRVILLPHSSTVCPCVAPSGSLVSSMSVGGLALICP